MNKSYLYILLLFVCCIIFSKCSGGDEEVTPPEQPAPSEAELTMLKLWETSPLSMNTAREEALAKIQQYSDNCLSTYFKNYLKSLDNTCESMEKNDLLLKCYRMAFDRVFEGIKNEKVNSGEVHIWMLYNMGYVVKTPSGCFGIDIYHRWAKKLAPYLDFLCITHNHQDHYSEDLINALFDAGKPVLSNYLKQGTGYAYTSTSNKNYAIGKFSIRTAITDHNNTSAGRNFVTVFRIDCGEDTGNFTLLHGGDSNFIASQFADVKGAVNVLIIRYAPNALTENNILGAEIGQIQPDCVLLSHILELSHEDTEGSRWSVNQALERASKINCEKTYVPMWGEQLIIKN